MTPILARQRCIHANNDEKRRNFDRIAANLPIRKMRNARFYTSVKSDPPKRLVVGNLRLSPSPCRLPRHPRPVGVHERGRHEGVVEFDESGRRENEPGAQAEVSTEDGGVRRYSPLQGERGG